MAKRKRKQKQTLGEFRAWMQGVEELQAENWAPNREQWQLIRAKIDGIIEEEHVVEKVVQPAPVSHMFPQPANMIPGFVPPPPTGGIPPVDVEISPAARAMLDPSVNGGKVKTPDIDTSDGNITSPFS